MTKKEDITLSADDLAMVDSIRTKAKERARTSAVLSKNQNPSWLLLMDHISECFASFEGIRGFYNLISNEWAFVMTDAGRAHEMLRDALINAYIMKSSEKQSGLFEWKEPINWVAFTIENRGRNVIVRSTYYTDDGSDVDLTTEKKEAIEYRLREEAIPKLMKIIHEEYPYHKSPRVISSTDADIQIQNLYDYGDRYFTTGNGSFMELVYRLKGKDPLESVFEFDEWLEKE